MKIKMLETSYQLSNNRRTFTRHLKDRIYDIGEEDAKRIVESGAAVYAEGEENPPKSKPAPKKKKTKNVVEPPIEDIEIAPVSEPEEESDG
jgi:hypothetical protein